MIANIELTGVGSYTPDDTAKRYVAKKIGTLDRKAPRHARKSMTARVTMAEVNRANGNKYEVEVALYLPEKTITAKDSTVNVLAAVDIVEAKLVAQLSKYKAMHVPHIGRRKLLDRFKRSYAREQ